MTDLPRPRAVEATGARLTRSGFSARRFQGHIDQSWGVSSYSSLIRDEASEPESPDEDSTETELETEPLAPAQGIHAFPGGTRAGTCLHKILEQIDYSDRSQLKKIAAEWLAQFQIAGFDDAVGVTLERVLTRKLPGEEFALADITTRLPELEFTFAMGTVTAASLQKLFRETAPEFPATIGELQFQPRRGFMKGFIDVVFEREGKFYFADWKSNWLGPDASFYAADDLSRAMRGHFYTLQLSIYAVALHRFLKQRLRAYDYEKNFGGAFYVFLRGTENETGGVFHSRPPLAFIEKLDRLFHGNV